MAGNVKYKRAADLRIQLLFLLPAIRVRLSYLSGSPQI